MQFLTQKSDKAFLLWDLCAALAIGSALLLTLIAVAATNLRLNNHFTRDFQSALLKQQWSPEQSAAACQKRSTTGYRIIICRSAEPTRRESTFLQQD